LVLSVWKHLVIPKTIRLQFFCRDTAKLAKEKTNRRVKHVIVKQIVFLCVFGYKLSSNKDSFEVCKKVTIFCVESTNQCKYVRSCNKMMQRYMNEGYLGK